MKEFNKFKKDCVYNKVNKKNNACKNICGMDCISCFVKTVRERLDKANKVEISKLSGVSRAKIYLIIDGKQSPTIATLEKLSYALRRLKAL